MIIECKSCQKKFVVNDSAIGPNGRSVQCSNCSAQWLQMPISSIVNTDKSETDDNLTANEAVKASDVNTDKSETDDNLAANEAVKASDGKTYKFMGKQWAQLLPSGKTGKLAKKKITLELNRKTGKRNEKYHKKKSEITPSEETTQTYSEKDKGMGIFSFLIVLIIFFAAIILVLDTFKNQIIPFWPKLDNYLVYIFETINNIFIIIKDLFNNYK